jgi:hypothetical protein
MSKSERRNRSNDTGAGQSREKNNARWCRAGVNDLSRSFCNKGKAVLWERSFLFFPFQRPGDTGVRQFRQPQLSNHLGWEKAKVPYRVCWRAGREILYSPNIGETRGERKRAFATANAPGLQTTKCKDAGAKAGSATTTHLVNA